MEQSRAAQLGKEVMSLERTAQGFSYDHSQQGEGEGIEQRFKPKAAVILATTIITITLGVSLIRQRKLCATCPAPVPSSSCCCCSFFFSLAGVILWVCIDFCFGF